MTRLGVMHITALIRAEQPYIMPVMGGCMMRPPDETDPNDS